MRYLALLGLLGLQIILGTCGELKVIEKDDGSRLDLEAKDPEGTLLNCTLVTNAKKVYSLYPKNESPFEYSGYGDVCSLTGWDIDLSYAGLWSIITYTDKGNFTSEFQIRMIKEVELRPARVIFTYPNQTLQVELDADKCSNCSCIVTVPGFKKYDLRKEVPEGVTPLRNSCGMRLMSDKTIDGQWELRQEREHEIDHALFHLSVSNEIDHVGDSTEQLKETWMIGEERTLEVHTRNIIFCQWTRPDGSKTEMNSGRCSLTIKVVSEFHTGTWRATYALVGRINLVHTEFLVTVKDPKFIQSSYTYSGEKTGEINILCQTGETQLRYCSFIRPDNYLVHLPYGVGNENYSYYGKGYSDEYSPHREYGECGITIHKPDTVDFGVWNCEMGLSDNRVRGAIINVKQAPRSIDSDLKSMYVLPTVYVKHGVEFKIKCHADAILKYCWLSSPNGTAYSVQPEGVPGSSLKYAGKGFEIGECGAIVPLANGTDNGNWTCHLGNREGFEVEQVVPVKVTDSYLVPTEEVVHASTEVRLACRTFIVEEATIDYCRWVRPDNSGINRSEAYRYQQSQDMHQCGLTIYEPQESDIGKWTCIAVVSRYPNVEQRATVQVKRGDQEESMTASILSIVLGTGLLIVALIGSSCAAFFVYKKRNARKMKSPPPYYPDDCVIHSQYNVPNDFIPEKENKY